MIHIRPFIMIPTLPLGLLREVSIVQSWASVNVAFFLPPVDPPADRWGTDAHFPSYCASRLSSDPQKDKLAAFTQTGWLEGIASHRPANGSILILAVGWVSCTVFYGEMSPYIIEDKDALSIYLLSCISLSYYLSISRKPTNEMKKPKSILLFVG